MRGSRLCRVPLFGGAGNGAARVAEPSVGRRAPGLYRRTAQRVPNGYTGHSQYGARNAHIRHGKWLSTRTGLTEISLRQPLDASPDQWRKARGLDAEV